jgi:DNA-binding winged helix-turn-helix (wHTH) protein/tetratricopeptide (TPR) repeat protein
MEKSSRAPQDSSTNLKPADRTSGRLYAFDSFRLDIAKLLLERNGHPVALPPKAVTLLALLVGNSGRLLTKDELFTALWPNCIVEESNLTQYVFLLRKALGQGRHDRRYIVTVPNQGYRFVAPVREVPEGAGSSRPPAASPARSVAVLPFQYLASTATDEYIGLGLADALITRLSYLPGVKVRPTSAVVRYAHRGQDDLTVAQDLGVDYVVTGTVQKFGDRLRVTVQMLQSNDGSVMWARQFDEDFTTLFAVEDSLSQHVLRFLAPSLVGERERELPWRSAVDSSAYHSYLKGRFFWNKRTEDGFHKAISCFRAAIDKDPGYAPAYAGLADCYNLLGYYAEYPPSETYPAAKAAVMQALDLDNRLAEAHASLALVAAEYDWDWERAEREYLRALELNPNYATAHSWFADFPMATGRQEESLVEIQRSQDLDPVSLVFNCDAGFLLYMARRYDEAIGHLSDTLDNGPRPLACPSVSRVGTGCIRSSRCRHRRSGDSLRTFFRESGCAGRPRLCQGSCGPPERGPRPIPGVARSTPLALCIPL